MKTELSSQTGFSMPEKYFHVRREQATDGKYYSKIDAIDWEELVWVQPSDRASSPPFPQKKKDALFLARLSYRILVYDNLEEYSSGYYY